MSDVIFHFNIFVGVAKLQSMWNEFCFSGDRKYFLVNIIVIIGQKFRAPQDLLVLALKGRKDEEKLKRRAKPAGNRGSKIYPQPFTPLLLLTGIQTTFVASLCPSFQFGQSVLCLLRPNMNVFWSYHHIFRNILKECVFLCVWLNFLLSLKTFIFNVISLFTFVCDDPSASFF